jgi:hypothetical protein
MPMSCGDSTDTVMRQLELHLLIQLLLLLPLAVHATSPLSVVGTLTDGSPLL